MPTAKLISQTEYYQRITSTATLPEAQARAIHLDAMIDYKLGTDFPADRREAMQKVDRKMQKGFLGFLVGSVLSTKLPLNRENLSDAMATRLFDRYREVLSEEEFAVFFKDSLPQATQSPSLKP